MRLGSPMACCAISKIEGFDYIGIYICPVYPVELTISCNSILYTYASKHCLVSIIEQALHFSVKCHVRDRLAGCEITSQATSGTKNTHIKSMANL